MVTEHAAHVSGTYDGSTGNAGSQAARLVSTPTSEVTEPDSQTIVQEQSSSASQGSKPCELSQVLARGVAYQAQRPPAREQKLDAT